MAISVTAPAAVRALAAPLRALAAFVLRAEARKVAEIGIVLTGDAELRTLNRRWRKIDRATDVISFAYHESTAHPERQPVAGDLVISLDRVRVQAKRFRVSEGAELARLVVHGALHLAGHDHQRVAERRVMREREDALLAGARPLVRRLERGLPAVRRTAR